MSFISSFLNLLRQSLISASFLLLCLGYVSTVSLLKLLLVSGFQHLGAVITIYSLACVDSILDQACAIN